MYLSKRKTKLSTKACCVNVALVSAQSGCGGGCGVLYRLLALNYGNSL